MCKPRKGCNDLKVACCKKNNNELLFYCLSISRIIENFHGKHDNEVIMWPSQTIHPDSCKEVYLCKGVSLDTSGTDPY